MHLPIVSKSNQDSMSEPSHSSGPALDQVEFVLPDLGDNDEAMESSGQTSSLPASATGGESTPKKTSTKRNRRKKVVKLYERQDSDDPRIPRAINAKTYRERKKQAEEKLKAENSSLQEKCQHLSDELEKCRKKINTQDESIKKLESEKQQLAAQNKELEGISKKVPTRVQTVKMIEYFRDTVSKLPNNCQVVITPQLAEMRVPQLSVGCSDPVSRDAGEDVTPPEGSEPFLKLTAFYDVSGGTGFHSQKKRKY